MRSMNIPIKKKHARMACVSCRESKVKVVNIDEPSRLEFHVEMLISRSVMVGNQHVPLVSTEIANAAIRLSINESELHLLWQNSTGN